jgi:hypothetical protein
VRWYLENKAWVEEVRTGEYHRWLSANYETRDRLLEGSQKRGVA